jgi:transposase-like protein
VARALPRRAPMNLGSRARLPLQCHYADCLARRLGPRIGRIVRRGSFFRTSDSRVIARFECRVCRRSFSQASSSPCFGQKRRNLNGKLRLLLGSGVSQRRAARILRTNRKTVVRKFLFLGLRAEQRQERFLASLRLREVKISAIQFDELESFEHSKCKPLSIPLVVLPKVRKILALDVCQMPAKGPLAEISRRKYGPRPDERAGAAYRVLSSLEGVLCKNLEVLTDEKPQYPAWLNRALGPARVQHGQVKGRRGCVVGQGELKRGGFDPLFSLNHTAAQIRANVNRMFRRTWCTTKRRDRLRLHLLIYADIHNSELTPALAP